MTIQITSEDCICYKLDSINYTAKVIYSPNAKNSINIPRSIRYQEHDYVIISITNGSFKRNYDLFSVKFPEDSSLLTIEKNSFSYSFLNSLFIPASVKELQEGWCNKTHYLKSISISPNNEYFKYDDEHQIIVRKLTKESENFDVLVFANRNIENANIPSTIKHIESYAFDQCNVLKEIKFPEDSELLSIGKKSICSYSLQFFYIPSKLEKIQDDWNNNCDKLTQIMISSKNKNFKYNDHCNQLIVGKSNVQSNDFDDLIFVNHGIEELTIPDNIKHIYSNCFFNNKTIRKINFSPNTQLQTIGKMVFSFSSIIEIKIPKNVTEIGKKSLGYCDLTTIIFENGSRLQNIQKKLFDCDKHLKKVEIPVDSFLRVIEDNAFDFSPISELYLPSTVEKIEEKAFENIDDNTKIIISPNNQHFAYMDENNQIIVSKSDKNSDDFDIIVFECDKKITSVTIPKNIKHIKSYAFKDCLNLKKIIIPKDSELRTLGVDSFKNTIIESFFISSKLEKIGKRCFYSDFPNNLNMRFCISPDNQNFKWSDENCRIVIGKSDNNKDDYDVICFANQDFKYAIIPDYIKYINPYAFFNTSVENVEISENSQLKSIGEGAFSFSNIKLFKVSKQIEIIDKSIFFGCSFLEVFEVENGSKLVAFPDLLKDCNSLKEYKIPDDCALKIIDDIHNTSIESFYIPSKIIWIDCLPKNLKKISISPKNQFYKFDENQIIYKKDENDNYVDLLYANRNIKKVIIPASIKRICHFAFENCTKLEFIIFQKDSNLQEIGYGAFRSSLIKRITIPKKIEYISSNAFENCQNLESIEFLGSSLTLYKIDCSNLQIVSCPNLKNLKFVANDLPKCFLLYVPTGIKIDA